MKLNQFKTFLNILGDKKENEGEALIDDNIKTVVPEGIVCATRKDALLDFVDRINLSSVVLV